MEGKAEYEAAFRDAISQILDDYRETVVELDKTRSLGKEEYKREMDLYKLSQLSDIVKKLLIPKDKELRNILLSLRKAIESQVKFRDLDLKLQWGIASTFERGKAGFYITESTELYKKFAESFDKKFGK